jgi:hypothetical protein
MSSDELLGASDGYLCVLNRNKVMGWKLEAGP